MKIMTQEDRLMPVLKAVISLAIAGALASPASAQTGGGYDLSWSTIDGGGNSSNGGTYNVFGVAGQPEHETATGGSFAVAGGFLGSFAGLAPVDPPVLVSLNYLSSLMLEVTFSEPMGTAASDTGSYTVGGVGRGTLAANPAVVTNVGGNTYRLMWVSGAPMPGQQLTVTVDPAVTDAEGEAMGTPATLFLNVPGTSAPCACPI